MKAIGLRRFSENCDRRNGGLELKLHSSNPEPLMSALGQKQTFASDQLMSALPPKADIRPQANLFGQYSFIPRDRASFYPQGALLHRNCPRPFRVTIFRVPRPDSQSMDGWRIGCPSHGRTTG